MFNLSEKIKEKFEALTAGFRPQLALVEANIVHMMGVCNPCTGCGGNCSGSCAGSCRGNCSGSCQRYQR